MLICLGVYSITLFYNKINIKEPPTILQSLAPKNLYKRGETCWKKCEETAISWGSKASRCRPRPRYERCLAQRMPEPWALSLESSLSEALSCWPRNSNYILNILESPAGALRHGKKWCHDDMVCQPVCHDQTEPMFKPSCCIWARHFLICRRVSSSISLSLFWWASRFFCAFRWRCLVRVGCHEGYITSYSTSSWSWTS